MKSLLKILLAAAILWPTLSLVSGCSDEDDCSMTARPMTLCNVCHYVDSTYSTRTDTLDSLHVTAFGTDSVILNRGVQIKSLSLPLRYTEDSTKLVFDYINPRLKDTVTIYHTNTPYFVSMDCGYQMKQAIEEVKYTRHLLDSISITNTEPGIYGLENIKLFY